MKRAHNRRALKAILILGLATALTLNVGAFTGQRQPSGEPRLSSIKNAGKERRRISIESQIALAEQPARRAANKAWLLQPEVFDDLSAGGKRAALSLNGLARNGLAPRAPSRRSGFVMQTAPGDNIRVNDPSMDEAGSTNSETSIAVNGQNIVVSFNDAAFFDIAGYSFSTDGGNTFKHQRIPTPDKGFGDSYGDGVVAYGPNGELYYSTIADDRHFTIFVGVAKSTDNGATFSEVADASTSADSDTDFQDKPWVGVDHSPTSPFKGNVYSTWTDFTQSNGSFINCSRSTNGGESFKKPVAISAKDGSNIVQGSMPAVSPNGDLYVAYTDHHFNTAGGISIVKSTDGGATFGAPKSVAKFIEIRTVSGGGNVRTNSFPWIVVDKNSVVHIAYDATPAPGSDRSDIFYTRSTDGGATFSLPRRVNDDSTSTTQIMPSIAAAADGTLGIKWWDRRNDPANDGLTDVYMSISRDGGASFEKNFRITNQNWVFGPVESGLASGYHGDYDGIAADGNNFFLSWSDERNGDPDAYFTGVPVARDANLPDFNISSLKLFDSVIQGQPVDFDFATSTAGLPGPLTLTASPAIGGLSYTFANASINPGDPARLTVSTTSATAPGTYLVSVAAMGQGLTRKSEFRIEVLDSHRSFGAPRNITKTPGFSFMRNGLKEDAAGTLHIAFDDDTMNVTESDAYYSKSTDGGATYSPRIKLSSGALGFNSTLALDANGAVYVAWTGFNEGQLASQLGLEVYLSKSTDGGNTFSSPVGISSTSQHADLANIAVDKNGNVLATYLEVSTSSPKLFAARSSNGGASFSTPVQVSQPSEVLSGLGGPIAFDSAGAAYVVYSNLAVSLPTINLAIASDGQHFSTSKVISDASIAAFASNLAVDRSDNLYVTFYNRGFTAPFFSREVILIKSTDHGNAFRPQIDASNTFGESTIPFVILGKSGEVNLVWQDTEDDDQGDPFLSRSTDGGIAFTAPVNLSANLGAAAFVSGASDVNGNIVTAWVDDSPANPDIFSVALGGLPAPAPDFALVFNPTEVEVSRASTVTIGVFISRPGGFAGNVTVTAPDVSTLKIKLKGADTKSTTGEFVSFNLKLKGGGPTGIHDITFSARDDAGRVRNATLTLFIFSAE
jgi:hypothetical protein